MGNKINIRQNEMEYAWFEEGFNDYIVMLVLAKTKMINQTEFIDYVNNENPVKHYKSPVRTAPADSIEKYFWDNGNYERLPYHSGFIDAFYFDNQIRLASAGKQTIQDFFIALLKRVRAKQNGIMTIDDYVETASQFIPKSQVQFEVKKYLQDGELLDFHHIVLANGSWVSYQNDVLLLTQSADASFIAYP